MSWTALINHLKRWTWREYCVFLLIICATYLRFWNLEGSMLFLGDQGRDALVVSRIFKNLDPVLIGPVTSIGNMYLGPAYYYFMLPFLMLSYPSPMGPVYAVATVGVLTVLMMYLLGRDLIGRNAALMATLFYAFSQVTVRFSRFSWNPNPAPFISLLMLWATFKALKDHPKWWLLVALCFSLLAQLHYLALLSAAGVGLAWLWQAYQVIKNKTIFSKDTFFTYTLGGILVFIVSLTPLFLFDVKHDFLNSKALVTQILGKDNFTTTSGGSLLTRLTTTAMETHGRGMHILFEHSLGQIRWLNTWLLIGFLLLLIYKVITAKKYQVGHWLILCFLLTGIVGTAFYRHSIFDHYISYLFPITFLVWGVVTHTLITVPKLRWIGLPLVAFFIASFLYYNSQWWSLETVDRPITAYAQVAQEIYKKTSSEKPYSIVLLSSSKDLYGMSYRYFLNATSHPPLEPEAHLKAEEVYIINEEGIENPQNLPIYEILVFPDKEPKEVYTSTTGTQLLILRKDS